MREVKPQAELVQVYSWNASKPQTHDFVPVTGMWCQHVAGHVVLLQDVCWWTLSRLGESLGETCVQHEQVQWSNLICIINEGASAAAVYP